MCFPRDTPGGNIVATAVDDVFVLAVFEQVEVQLKIIATTEAIIVSIIKLDESLN